MLKTDKNKLNNAGEIAKTIALWNPIQSTGAIASINPDIPKYNINFFTDKYLFIRPLSIDPNNPPAASAVRNVPYSPLGSSANI